MSDTEKPESIEKQPGNVLLNVFYATVAVFVILIGFIFFQNFIPGSEKMFRYIFFPGIATLTLLGIILIILAYRSKVRRSLRTALLLTGISAVGMPLCAVLHNLVYGLLIMLFGENVWGAAEGGGDEAFLFILALIIFPLTLIVSAVTAVVIMHNTKGQSSA